MSDALNHTSTSKNGLRHDYSHEGHIPFRVEKLHFPAQQYHVPLNNDQRCYMRHTYAYKEYNKKKSGCQQISVTFINPSSPKGGCTNPPNGFRPGAQNRTAKGYNCSGYLQVHPFPSF